MATESSVGSSLPASELTPEAREHRRIMSARLNRCIHGVNAVLRRCKECEAAGVYAADIVTPPNARE